MIGNLNPHVHVPYGRLGEFAGLLRTRSLAPEIYVTSGDLDSLSPAWLDETLSILDYKPEISVHAPFMDLSPGGADEKIRALSVERFTKTLDMAASLGAKAVVFHSGYEKWRFAMRVDIWLQKSLLTWEPLIEKAKKAGIRIAIENIFEDDPQNLFLLMRALGSEDFGICFDAGHFNLFSKRPLREWLDALQDYIIELHLHDNDRTFDQHRPIGDGTFPFGELFGALAGRRLIHTVEAHSAEDALLSIERLKGFFPKGSSSDF